MFLYLEKHLIITNNNKIRRISKPETSKLSITLYNRNNYNNSITMKSTTSIFLVIPKMGMDTNPISRYPIPGIGQHSSNECNH